MFCSLQPLVDGLGELDRRHTGVRRSHDLEQTLLARRRQGFGVTLQRGLVRLGLRPVGMLGRQRFDLIDGVGELEIDRLLGP
jgi:hypothetical protein